MDNVIYLGENMGSIKVLTEDDKMIRNLRAIFKRNEICVERRSGKDRRFSFFSFLIGDKRSGFDRRKNA
jgi:hypothetical protein